MCLFVCFHELVHGCKGGFACCTQRFVQRSMSSDVDPHAGYADPLVLNIQLIYDGHIPHWTCIDDSHADSSQ
jgi:hypothetical protein